MMFDESRLKDPGFFRENRLEPHSDHDCAPAFRLSLCGLWKFFHARNPGQVIPGFEQPDYDVRGWSDIHVPAHIQMEGYGVPQYCNTEYPWDGQQELLPGQLPEIFNPVACYVKDFQLPREMRDKRVFISFQGAESCVALWLNGQYIGFSSDSFTPHEFELTDALREGTNRLACRVYRFCAGSWLEDQDFLRFSGLYREVFLYAVPCAHVWDLQTVAEPDETCTRGLLRWKARLTAPRGTALKAGLWDGETELAVQEHTIGEETEVSGALEIDAPRLWSAEQPNLYRLELRLTAPDGTEEKNSLRVGFRRVEIRDGVIRVNGVRVVFKGVNRHDFCGETGRAVTEEKVRRDLQLMKRNNINAVRTSHYPNNSSLYRLCDELGLYVIDENNMETHGMWDMLWQGYIGQDQMFPGNQEAWQPLLLDRVRSMVGRDRNHPSVLIWSCGNESLTGSVILAMSREMKKLDPTRPVHYEGDSHAPADLRIREITDIESEMYTPADRVRAYVREHPEKPFILCEYTHSMGNSNGAMHKYTRLAYEEEHYQGGFIWDFIDQALTGRDPFGQEALLYGGDWGDRPTDGIFCGNGIVFADGRETPKLQEVKFNYQDIEIRPDREKVEIRNRHMFTSTSAFRCVATLQKDGLEIDRRELSTDVPPLSSAVIPLPFGAPAAPGEYAVTVSFLLKKETAWAPAGHEIAFGQGIWQIAGTPEKTPEEPREEPLFCMNSPWNITVRGAHFQLQFSRLGGALTSYRWGDTELLKAPLVPNFWRAPTNNDYGNRMPQRYAQWKIASMYAGTGITRETMEKNAAVRPVREEDGSVSFRLAYDLPTCPAAACEVAYRVFPDGRVQATLTFDPVRELGDMPEFGMLLKLDREYDRVRFYGLGPQENYTDRREGARLGVWDYRVAENLTPYLLPQECGNRTGVRWAEVTNARGQGLKLWLEGGEFSALPYTPHELENAAHAFELPPVASTVVKMSLAQMGVGGDDSWGARTHPEYLLDISKPLRFTFSFRGI